MGLTKGIPAEGGSGGGRGHSAMEHWMKTAEIKDAARVVRRRADREEVSGGLSEASHLPPASKCRRQADSYSEDWIEAGAHLNSDAE